MRERKLRSVAESLVRLRESLIPYTQYIYKIQKVCGMKLREWSADLGNGQANGTRKKVMEKLFQD